MKKGDWRYNRFQQAKEDEAFVASALTINIGGPTSAASFSDDCKRHIDLWWDSPKKGIIGIDVKGVKCNSTKDGKRDDSINWLELTNTTGGTGWLRGDAEYIAFRTRGSVLFVPRKKLLDHTLKQLENKPLTTTTPTDFYVPYQRQKWGNKDIVCKCPTSDLYELATFKIDNAWTGATKLAN